MYATHASVVIVNPNGTRSGPSSRVISATPAPLPPSSSRMSREPSVNVYTHLVIAAPKGARDYLPRGGRARTPRREMRWELYELAVELVVLGVVQRAAFGLQPLERALVVVV